MDSLSLNCFSNHVSVHWTGTNGLYLYASGVNYYDTVYYLYMQIILSCHQFGKILVHPVHPVHAKSLPCLVRS